ncbi:MAG: hypothetical protein CVV27_17355 [Candidatus Melainabacteria bacterium HGW-Melainabacteria-1]|nr:MAG: hypothetical protein CVV27_17355 [Candidatus Melainabacteria bacterium HGW-Melainabacteria-1]
MMYAQYPPVQANYAYSQYSVVDEMASRHRVMYNPNAIAGMPGDTFRKSHVLTSSRSFTPPSQAKVMAKEFGSFFRDLSTVLSVVGLFAPPVAAIAAVAGPVSSMVSSATSQIDTRPQAVQVASAGRYNYWFR